MQEQMNKIIAENQAIKAEAYDLAKQLQDARNQTNQMLNAFVMASGIKVEEDTSLTDVLEHVKSLAATEDEAE